MLVPPRRVLLFGATGRIGQRVAHVLRHRGHAVLGVTRTTRPPETPCPAIELAVGDARDHEKVRELASGRDVVIAATRPASGREGELVDATRGLLAGLRGLHLPLVLVGGAARLLVPGSSGRTVLEDRFLVQDAWRDLAGACVDQFRQCERESDTPWTYVSPPAFLDDGPATGRYRLAQDELVVDHLGQSRLGVDDFALAVADLAETAGLERRRFAVGPC